jgi:hypothetical protein
MSGGHLDAIARMLVEAADRWDLRVNGYHDAGCASVMAAGRAVDDRPVLVKAWFDRTRHAHETAALRWWPATRVPALLHVADDLSAAVVEVVGGRPGGRARPDGEYEYVALGLDDLHAPVDLPARRPAGVWVWTLSLLRNPLLQAEHEPASRSSTRGPPSPPRLPSARRRPHRPAHARW